MANVDVLPRDVPCDTSLPVRKWSAQAVRGTFRNQVSQLVLPPEISFFLPALEGGGAERVFVELANEFVGLGLRVDMALASAQGPYLGEVSAGVRVVDFESRGVMACMPKLRRYLRSERPQAMLSGLDHANIVAVLARVLSSSDVRCVVSMRSVPSEAYRNANSTRTRAVFRLMRLAYRFADALIANSQAVALDAARHLSIAPGKVAIVYNPLNLARIQALSQEATAHPWCDGGAAPVILSVGRLDAMKDFPTLIRAFAQVRSCRDCHLVILGEGPERTRLEHLVCQLGVSRDVQLPGFAANPFGWMRNSKVFVSSSVSEGCPNALMQAMACGTPVISTDCVGGSAEILQQGRWGRLVPVADCAAMAEAIVSVLDERDHPDVRCRASDFSHDEIARQYLRVLLPNDFPEAAEGKS